MDTRAHRGWTLSCQDTLRQKHLAGPAFLLDPASGREGKVNPPAWPTGHIHLGEPFVLGLALPPQYMHIGFMAEGQGHQRAYLSQLSCILDREAHQAGTENT